MKSLLIALLFACFSTAAFAHDIEVARPVLKAFEKKFNDAKDVSWSRVDGMYKASFTIDNKAVYAFFNDEGVLSAATRYIHTEQLPMPLQSELKKQEGIYRLYEIFEVSDESTTTYYASLKSNNRVIVLQSSGNKWQLFRKAKM